MADRITEVEAAGPEHKDAVKAEGAAKAKVASGHNESQTRADSVRRHEVIGPAGWPELDVRFARGGADCSYLVVGGDARALLIPPAGSVYEHLKPEKETQSWQSPSKFTNQ